MVKTNSIVLFSEIINSDFSYHGQVLGLKGYLIDHFRVDYLVRNETYFCSQVLEELSGS